MATSSTMARRAGWGIADQALSSLTNLALGIAVARSVSTEEFGAFSLAFATYLLALVVSRSAASQPLVIRFTAVDPTAWREGVGRSLGAATAMGLAAAGVAGVTALLTDGPLAGAFAALALTLPGLLVQDAWRFAFFAKGQGRSAFFNDLVWAAVLLPPLIAVTFGPRPSVFAATLVWGVSATVAALFGIYQASVWPQPAAAARWWQEHRDVIPSYVAEFGSVPAAAHIALFLIGGVTSLVVVGALRAAEMVIGPVRLLFEGVGLMAQPEAVRLVAAEGRVLRAGAAMSAGLAAVAATVGVGLLALPDRAGVWVLGDTWSAAQPVLLPLIVVFAAAGVIVGAQIGLHALVAIRRTLKTRLIMSVGVVVLSVAGAGAAGAPGAAGGRAVAMSFGAVLWWVQFVRAYRERHPAHP